MASLFLSTFIKFFFLLTPFFALSTFLSMTQNFATRERRVLALKVTLAVLVTSLVIFWAGNFVFQIFGITLEAFRVGTGILLLLTAISLVQSQTDDKPAETGKSNIAVVPLAIPVTVGPATTGALMVMGGDLHSLEETVISLAALALAIAGLGLILFLSAGIERVIKKQGIVVLSKITGLILSALASQLILTGLKAFFHWV